MDLYANDFAGLTQADLAYQGIRQRALESALGNAMAGLSAMANREQKTREFGQELAIKNAQLDQAARHLALTADHYKDESAYRDKALQIQRDQLDWMQKQPTSAGQRADALRESYAGELAARGEPVNDLGLPKETEPIFSRLSESSRRGLESQRSLAQADADVLNTKEELENRKRTLENYVSKLPLYVRALRSVSDPMRIGEANQQINDYAEQLNELTPRVAEVLRTAEKKQHVYRHPERGWMPTINVPSAPASRELRYSTGDTGQEVGQEFTPGETTGGAAAPAPTSAGGRSKSSGVTTTVAPVTMPQAAPAVTTTSTGVSEPTVDVQTPDGRIWRKLPVSRLAEAQARGAKVLTNAVPSVQQMLGQ